MTPWTAAYQAPPSMGFSRQEYWSGVPSPNPNQMTASVISLVSPAALFPLAHPAVLLPGPQWFFSLESSVPKYRSEYPIHPLSILTYVAFFMQPVLMILDKTANRFYFIHKYFIPPYSRFFFKSTYYLLI